MEEYLELVKDTLENGDFKDNRTNLDTISNFNYNYSVDLNEGFPLLTTKKMSGFRFNSMVSELLWYLSGEEHIRNLREETSIWDEWADDKGRLDTSYARFWRRYPIPENGLDGEIWAEDKWVNEDENTFDQIEYVIDKLKNNPHSRRIVVNAWHPGNASISKLPPCHYSFVFNVQNNKLNTHLTQRSGDIALGIPFNITSYSILTHMIANQVDNLQVGKFAHTIIDAHIYCGKQNRSSWYKNNLEKIQVKIKNSNSNEDYIDIKNYIEDKAPDVKEEGNDHVIGLLKQLSREPLEKPKLDIPIKDIDEYKAEDIKVKDYENHPGIKFNVAE